MGSCKSVLASLLFLTSTLSFGQTANRYVVHLKDKTNTPYQVSNPGEFLSVKAIERRTAQNIVITEEDLPVDPDYIAQIESAGVEVFFKSRWFNNVLIQANESQVASIASLPFVDNVEFVAPGNKLKSNSRVADLEDVMATEAVETDFQNNLLGVQALHEEGYEGQGVAIAFMDGGFLGVNSAAPFEHLITNNKIVYKYNLVENDDNPFQYLQHGTQVFSTVAALVPDSYVGIAPAADFMLFITEDDSGNRPEYRVEEYNFLYAAEMADSAGVDIINASIGYNTFDLASMDYTFEQMDGNTTVITRAAEKAFSKGILVVTSAGNQGSSSSWPYVTAPADGPNVLSVGSVDSNLLKSSFSSMGPTSDGRTKPDLVAYGRSTALVDQSGSIVSNSGTSFASPQIAGLAALIWQKNPDLTNKELFDLLLSYGSQFENPDNTLGYGIPNYLRAITGIDNLEEQEVLISPNPFSRSLKVQAGRAMENYNFSILDSSGKVIKVIDSETNSEGSINLDLNDINSGFYLLKVQGGDGKMSIHRIIKF